jgi:DNA-binding NarL/FixJ family response regulator
MGSRRSSLKWRRLTQSSIATSRAVGHYNVMQQDLTTVRILCVDDHPLFREGIAAVVAQQPDMHLVATAGTGTQAIEEHRQHRPDITLMDLRLPDMCGIAVMNAIRAEVSAARIIVLTNFEGDVEIQLALESGARGYMLKSSSREKLIEGIRKVHAGRVHLPSEVAETLAEHMGLEALTEREVEVLRRIADGNRNQDIAGLLSISEETVKVHIRHIMEKLGARDRTQAVSIAVRRGIFHI